MRELYVLYIYSSYKHIHRAFAFAFKKQIQIIIFKARHTTTIWWFWFLSKTNTMQLIELELKISWVLWKGLGRDWRNGRCRRGVYMWIRTIYWQTIRKSYSIDVMPRSIQKDCSGIEVDWSYTICEDVKT